MIGGDKMDWMDELNARAKEDPWHQCCLADVVSKETAFLKIREGLSEQQRSDLDAYIAACEELEHALIP